MRSHAKAATAGTIQRRAKRKPAQLLCVLAGVMALLALVVSSAGAAKTHLFKEVFGSAAQPAFTTPRGMAIDQGTGDIYVIDAGTPPSVKRFNPDGTADSFSALSSNAIDGKEGADATPQVGLAFGAANRVQIAIDESGTATDGNIYVAQAASKLVDVFAPTGAYLGQLTESSTGALGEVCGVAVDTAGALYVGDISGKVHKYAPAANPPVKADNTASFATVAAPCQIAAGTGPTAGFIFVNRSNGELLKVDSSTGESKYPLGSVTHRTVYVDPASGHVYAPRQTGANSEVVEYDASGVASATTVSSVKPGSTIEGVAVREASGDIYLTRQGQAQAQVYGPTVTVPDVVTSPVSGNTGTRATLNGTVNPDGVELSECFFEWSKSTGSFENSAPCAESNATIGSGTSPVAVHADISGLAPQGIQYKYRLVAKNPETPAVTGSQQNFNTPTTVVTTAASGITPTEATLNGTVNPDTATISECVFEWGPLVTGPGEQVQTYETAPCVPGSGSITGTSPVAVAADISGLTPGTTYIYRLKAAYPAGPVTGQQLTVQSLGPAIVATWSEDVIYTEATLAAEINPAGKATTYQFEWGTTTAYGSSGPEQSAGSSSSNQKVSLVLDELQPDTTYHYRLVATNADATSMGPDRTLTTFETFTPDTGCPNQAFRYGAGANLPDCRAYEMVSPVDKNGGDITTACAAGCVRTALQQSSPDGEKITYSSRTAFGDALSAPYSSQYIADRGPGGWSTHAVSPPRTASTLGGIFGYAAEYDLTTEFKAFTPDLSRALLINDDINPLTSDALEGHPNAYWRENASDAYEALTTFDPPVFNEASMRLAVVGLTDDAEHALISAAAALTPDAGAHKNQQLYVHSDGELHLVSVLPSGEASLTSSTPGTKFLAPNPLVSPTVTRGGYRFGRTISGDGSRIFWSTGLGSISGPIYMRENPAEEQSALNGSDECTEAEQACTVQVASGIFWTATPEGSKVLYTNGAGTLTVHDIDAKATTPIADEVLGVAGASDDLSRVYFLSTEALDGGAIAGRRNLYLYDEGAITLIAELSVLDTGLGNNSPPSPLQSEAGYHNVRVTPDGAHIAFGSSQSLTGYDNTDVVTGDPDFEVFLYDAEEDELTCASCNPSGARPVGAEAKQPYTVPSFGDGDHYWAAAWLNTSPTSLYSPRPLADDGSRLFFNAFDALVPQDTNGRQDVYQWEEQGIGGCRKPDGCISLISTGQSGEIAEFVDASTDGRDVFFETTSGLDPRDAYGNDIYDARAGGGYPPPPPAGVPCVGDACQSIPQAPDAQTPASASFRGAGDRVSTGSCGPQARQALKLSRRAKRLHRAAKRSSSAKRSKRLRARSARYAKQAKRLSSGAKRCRRANRRAGR